MRRTVTLADTIALRATPGATVALFVTDRCPVGCAHCSVDSRPDSPTITDRTRFAEIVAAIAGLGPVRAVAITGGEPFAERWGLRLAVTELTRAGKDVVLYTSGYWAARGPSDWVREVLATVSTVVLSTDSPHAAALSRTPDEHDRVAGHAAAAVLAAGAHLIVQVLDEPGLADRVAARYPGAEVSVIRRLPVGRGAALFAEPEPSPAAEFGPCRLLHAPVVRYDGTVSLCCNESVLMGGGPAALRGRLTAGHELAAVLERLRRHPVARLMARYGPGPLAGELGAERYPTVCGPCWAAHDEVAAGTCAGRRITALGLLP